MVTLNYAGTNDGNSHMLSVIDPQTGSNSTIDLPAGISGGIAAQDGQIVVSINALSAANGNRETENGSSIITISQGIVGDEISLPITPALVSFVGENKVAVEGISPEGQHSAIILDTTSGEIVSTLDLQTGHVWGMRRVNNKPVVLQDSSVSIFGEDNQLEKNLLLPGLTTTQLLP